jgi:hypothetical protein
MQVFSWGIIAPVQSSSPRRAHRDRGRRVHGHRGADFEGPIGEGTVVGAGAVVTQDVPPRTVVADNPAEVVREL